MLGDNENTTLEEAAGTKWNAFDTAASSSNSGECISLADNDLAISLLD